MKDDDANDDQMMMPITPLTCNLDCGMRLSYLSMTFCHISFTVPQYSNNVYTAAFKYPAYKQAACILYIHLTLRFTMAYIQKSPAAFQQHPSIWQSVQYLLCFTSVQPKPSVSKDFLFIPSCVRLPSHVEVIFNTSPDLRLNDWKVILGVLKENNSFFVCSFPSASPYSRQR